MAGLDRLLRTIIITHHALCLCDWKKPAKFCLGKILRARKNFTFTKKFYVYEIAAINLSNFFFTKKRKENM